MKYYFSFLLFVCFQAVNAQDIRCLTLVPKFQNVPLELNQMYAFQNDSLKVTNLKFYISNLQYFIKDSLIYISNKKAHLIDLSSNKLPQIFEKNSFDFDKVRFNMGIDSLTNVSGVFDGDLDPVNGMYWTWQSGYINFKLEGVATNSPSRNNKFSWHIGGYIEPFYAMREVTLNCNSKGPFNIVIQLDEIFNGIDVAKIYQVMSPNEKAIQIADELPKIFKIE